jgi:hypothetical protein
MPNSELLLAVWNFVQNTLFASFSAKRRLLAIDQLFDGNPGVITLSDCQKGTTE